MDYEEIRYNDRLWVIWRGHLIGGYNAKELRSYVFPLYTPRGALVLQEAPPDHPHHQGVWAGLEVDGNDLWNAGSRELPRHRQELTAPLAEIATTISDDGVQLTHTVRWTTVEGAELLQEQRTVSLSATNQFTLVEWGSVFRHPGKVTRLGRTKESGLGLRVPPHWETRFGGRIRNANNAQGEQSCFDQMSPWLNIEGRAAGDEDAGVIMIPTSVPCPWFTRDYGCHVYNPARHQAMALKAGEQLAWSMRVLAYDGARSVAEIDALVGSDLK